MMNSKMAICTAKTLDEEKFNAKFTNSAHEINPVDTLNLREKKSMVKSLLKDGKSFGPC